MTAVAAIIFWLSVALLGWVYAGYPLLAWAVGRLRPVRLRMDGELPASVTVGIAVHNGAGQVEERVRDVLSQAVSAELDLVVASDGSTDATADIVRRLAQAEPRLRLLELPRRGQSATQAAIFDSSTGEVVVITDVETRWASGFLAELLAPFADPRVGCATGVLRWRYDEVTDTAQHEGMYWRYEQLVRRWESRAGWLSAGTGALLAVRRSVYRPAPAHASLDQMLPLAAREQGRLVVAVPSAVGTDRGSSTLAEQVRSRIRIATQGIEANLRMATRITPWRSPGAALAIWSHKVLRWTTPWLALLAALAATALAVAGAPAYMLPVAAGLLVLGAGVVAYLFVRAGRRSPPLTTFPLTIVAVNVSFALAWLNVLLRRRMGSW